MAVEFLIDPSRVEDYAVFKKVKSLPRYAFQGRTAQVPEEYAALFDVAPARAPDLVYRPSPFCFDYQGAIAALAIRKRKFAAFVRCGLGKTNIMFEYARHVASVLPDDRAILIVSPLMVIRQTIAEAKRFYGDSLPIEQVRAAGLRAWLKGGEERIGITNFEAINQPLEQGDLGCLIIDESSMMKSHYGSWARALIDLGKGLDWKLCLTGTPAPNDRIEYGNHAVFLDQHPNVNAFLARYFVNRGKTENRWEIKPHAIGPFYRALSHWSIFLETPATYGWKDNVGTIPPFHVHIEDVPLTDEQQSRIGGITGDLYGGPGGITSRSKLAQLARGNHKGERIPTNKFKYIKARIESWPEESTLIWCRFNAEQDRMEEVLPGAGSIRGSTPEDDRIRIIEDFQAGRIKQLISKSDCLGFGLNLQIATRQVHSGISDSFEDFHQAVMRSSRIGSTRPLNVHVPVTPLERCLIENVLRKSDRVQADSEEQERIFKEVRYEG